MNPPVFQEIALALINEPDVAIRQAMDPAALEALAQSIRDNGQIHPLSVYPDGGRYTIAAGHRRYVALDMLGDRPARCLVYDSSTQAMLKIQIAENVHHEDMKPSDEAIWFARLMEGLGIDSTALADELKLNRNYIERRLALLGGDPRVFDAVAKHGLALGVAHELNDCKDPTHRVLLLDMAMHREATVATVAGWVAEFNAKGALEAKALEDTPPAAATLDPDAPRR